jgi:DNA-binding LytR/AlgR family response regulator
MINAIAIDDEPIALDIIRAHAEKVSFIQLKETFLSATEAFAYLKKESVDLVFLDIHMPDISGLEFAERIRSKAQIIFTTAYEEHALKGFELAATDYLLKPISFNRFLQACELADSRVQLPPVNDMTEPGKSLFVKDGHNWMQIKLNDLLYAQGQDNYVSIFENDKRVLTRMTLTELQNKLPADKFLRIHKSYIIAISKIEKIERHQVIIKGNKIPLSKASRDMVLQMLNK